MGELNIIEGTSGAVIVVDAGAVWKTAPPGPVLDRVIEQGRIMRDAKSPWFPTVYDVNDRGYIMHRLHPLVWTDKRRDGGVFGEMYSALVSIWGESVSVPLEWAFTHDHAEYVRQKTEAWPEVHRWLARRRTRLIEGGARAPIVSMTHGDPTIDNVMSRVGDPSFTGDLMFIDPLPVGHMTKLRAVDIGKMLQSVYGYEAIKYGRDILRHTSDYDVLRGLSPVEVDLAQYFLLLHIARLIPYQPEEKRSIFIDLMHDLRVSGGTR